MLIDLSYTINEFTPGFPGDEKIELNKVKNFAEDQYNSYVLRTNMHIGTHIDGIAHLADRNDYISDLDIAEFIGEGQYLELDKMRIGDILENRILVINTFTEFGDFDDYQELTLKIAEEIVRKNIRIIVLDSPSPDKEPYNVHKYLLDNNVLIVENAANLGKLKELERFRIYCIPLKIQAEASPIRLFAEEISNRE